MKIFLASSIQKQEHWNDTILFFEAVNLEYDYDKGLEILDRIEKEKPGFISSKFFD